MVSREWRLENSIWVGRNLPVYGIHNSIAAMPTLGFSGHWKVPKPPGLAQWLRSALRSPDHIPPWLLRFVSEERPRRWRMVLEPGGQTIVAAPTI